MKKSVRFIFTVLVLGSYLLSACAGAAPQGDDAGESPGVNSNEVLDVNENVNDNSSQTNENASDVQDNENDDNGNDNGDDNSNDNSNDSSDDDLELHGVIEALTAESITINGVVYNLADFTEFKDVVSVGDQIKIHFIVNADGTFTIREIELSSGDDDNANYNSNSNNNDDDSNGNSNDNDDDDDDNSNDGNSNDDKDDDNDNNNEKDDD